MKTFKDLKVGDNIYVCDQDNNKCVKIKITAIIDTEWEWLIKFYYGKSSYDYISIFREELGLNNIRGIFADVNSLLKYIEDER